MSAGRMDLILGGARSGKSDYALRLATRAGSDVTVVATAEAGDVEMARRIDIHRRSRPNAWNLVETPTGVAAALGADSIATLVLEDAALLVSNLLLPLAADVPQDASIGRRRASKMSSIGLLRLSWRR